MSSVPATCQISIRGAFDRRWADYLGEMLLDMDVQRGPDLYHDCLADIPPIWRLSLGCSTCCPIGASR